LLWLACPSCLGCSDKPTAARVPLAIVVPPLSHPLFRKREEGDFCGAACLGVAVADARWYSPPRTSFSLELGF
jgi:hypothetical protein